MNEVSSKTLLIGALSLVVLFNSCASAPVVDESRHTIKVTGAAINVVRLTDSADDEVEPAVSPNGAIVAFQVNKGGQYDILTIDKSGKSRQQVTDEPSNEVQPTWLPDNKTIVFASNRLGKYSLWKKRADGGGGTTMITKGTDMIDFGASASKDGKAVCFSSRGVGSEQIVVVNAGFDKYSIYRNQLPHIWKCNIDGTELTHFGPGAYPVWAPDNSKIAFSSDVSGNWDLWMMDAAGSVRTQITDDSKDQVAPSFSPDGKWIAYISNQAGSMDLWIMKVDGTSPTQITADSGEEGMPCWGPDNNIYFCSKKSGNWDIWRVTPSIPE
ncbi:MAG: hypothetical protein ACKVS6_16605 [Planctomycetota bacterium]